MKSKNLQRLLFFSLYGSLVVSAVGTMAGTYAWFRYTARLSTQFHGTTLNNSAHLKVGVISEYTLLDASEYGFVRDQDNKKIYWSEDGISAKSLSYFLSASGYAGSSLSPVTSGHYELNGDFSLKNRPVYLNNVTSLAKKEYYIYLPLVFQASDKDDNHYDNFDIKLTDVSLDDEDNGSLSKAIRINVLNKNSDENFLLNPSVIEDGYDVVGGTLDLDLDGYNDFDNQNRDFIYGEADYVTYNDEPSTGEDPRVVEDRTVFNAYTQSGVYGIDEDNTSFKRSNYLGRESVIARKNITSAAGDGLAYVDLTIYEEGWSTSATDVVMDNVFDLGLTFEFFNESNN